ncbi:MAG: NAD+ synthase [Syntrophus sp. (in: bacteria)]|nr:NAD+ synthase [Syntrophus sp. (in: bacteria)]
MGMMIRIGAAQINSIVGDLKGNCAKILCYTEKARAAGVDVVAFPELALTGYPPEDLLLKTGFIDDNLKRLQELAKEVRDITVIVGFVDRQKNYLFNAAAIIHGGRVQGVYHKQLLPNYGVFDEKRYFSAGTRPLTFRLNGVTFGVSICEDIWHKGGPTKLMAGSGAGLIFNINASPYHAGKSILREETVQEKVRESNLYICYANLIGGQDELVFDGQSFVMDKKGAIVSRAEAFKEDLLVVDIPVSELRRRMKKEGPVEGGSKINPISLLLKGTWKEKKPLPVRRTNILDPISEVYEALKLGLHDYVAKNGFKKTVIGLSGGIDSAIVAVLAADALGKENVNVVFMPSRYTSRESGEDASTLARNLGIELLEAPIDDVYRAYLSTLGAFFTGLKEDITEENIQARIRGNILMALSNKFGWLVLTTGNKSEMSVGYATLYGDMAGGFAVIKDVPKTLVYKLSLYRNTLGAVMPESILTKEPTAELKPDQKDRDNLPPYEDLDPILKNYVEENKDIGEINIQSMGKGEIEKVLRMVDISEYKRRQSPPGIKITPRAFGKDRRMPITNKYRGSQ